MIEREVEQRRCRHEVATRKQALVVQRVEIALLRLDLTSRSSPRTTHRPRSIVVSHPRAALHDDIR